jgi:hypothetical protein
MRPPYTSGVNRVYQSGIEQEIRKFTVPHIACPEGDAGSRPRLGPDIAATTPDCLV